MKCKTIHKKMFSYIEGLLSPDEFREISLHIQSCGQCKKKETVLKKALLFIEKEKEIVYDPFMFTRIQSKLSPYPESSNKSVLSPGLIFATIFIAALITGLILGNFFNYSNRLVNDYRNEIYYLTDIQKENIETTILSEEIK